MKKVCLIGYGKWGQKIYKKTNKIFDYKYVLRKKNSLKKKYLDNVDWVIVASPNKTHFKIVKKCLLNKKNVFEISSTKFKDTSNSLSTCNEK